MELVQNNNPTASIRLTSMFIDHAIMCIIAVAFTLPVMLSTFATSSFPNLNTISASSCIMCIGISLYFSKDCINGQSIAKRLFKLQIVDFDTENVASPLQCFVRDLFCILWPIEVIVTLVNPGRRIGDRIAGTKVIVTNTPQKGKLNYFQIAISLILGYAIMLLSLIVI